MRETAHKSSGTIRVLHVDDEPDFADLTTTYPECEDDRFVVETETSANEGLNRLNEISVDCVISGYDLPNMNGIAFLEAVRERYLDLPFILYTDAGNEAVASEAISAGVTDYIRTETEGNTELIDSVLNAVTEYQTQTKLRQKGRRYQAILDDPNLLVGILDTDGTLLEANQTAGEYISPDIEEMIGNPFWETLWWDEDTQPLVQRKIEQAASGEYVEYEADLTDAAGDPYSVTGTIRPVSDETGQVVSLVVSALDVTERKMRGRELKKERRFVQKILDTLPDAFYQFNTDGYLVRWNDQLETATGYSKEEMEEMYVTEFVPDDEIEPISQQFQEVISERRSVAVESAFETKGGERIPYEFTGAPVETSGGEIRGLIGIGRDLSDRKRQKRRFEAAFNNTYQFTGLMNPDGTLLEANQTALSFGNLNREDVVGEKIWDAYWFQASDTARETAAKAVQRARDGDLFREELEVQGAKRDAIIDFSVRPVTDEDGNVTLLIPEGRDITRLKEREQQLRVTNRVLRHNIRNQLTLIRGTAVSLGEANSGPVGQEAELIIDAANSLFETAETTRRLNEMVENETEPSVIDLTDCIETVVATISERYPEAELRIEMPKTASVEAIADIRMAIEELAENAIVHNERDHPRVTLSVTVRDTTVKIAVIDTAGGMPDIERNILTGEISIDPVAHGQGLGLWYIYWAVHYSGGSIEVSEHSDGSEVRMVLPQSD